MPPKPPPGMHYVPRQPGAAKPDPAAPAAPAIPAAAPALPAPGLATPPAHFYPSDGPTVEDWIMDQLAGMPVLAEAHTFTAVQTFSLSDHATGADDPALRPTLAYYDHRTDQTPVPGIGGSLTFRAQDTTPTTVEIARLCCEITGVVPGAVDATMAFCVMHQGQQCEVARVRGQLGMNATATPSGVYGYIGGQLYVRGDFLAGDVGLIGFGAAGAAGATVQITAKADADVAFQVKPRSAGQTGDLVRWYTPGGGYSFIAAGGGLQLRPDPAATWVLNALDPNTQQALFVINQSGNGGAIAVYNRAPGDVVLHCEGVTGMTNFLASFVALGSGRLDIGPNAEIIHQGTKVGFFSAPPVVQQVGASAGGIASITDAAAKTAITALQNALAAYGLVTAPP